MSLGMAALTAVSRSTYPPTLCGSVKSVSYVGLNTVLSVLLRVTREAKAGITVYGQCCGQAHCTCPLNVCKVCICMSDVL